MGVFDIVNVLAFAGDDPAHIDRLSRAMDEFNSVGIEVEPFWNVSTPYERIVERGINHNNLCKGAVLNITLGHLRMIKAAYNRGAERALFFEYDIRFLRNRDTLSSIFSSLPDNFDLAHFDWLPAVAAPDSEVEAALSSRVNECWCSFRNQRNSSAYGMSRRFMRKYIELLEAPASSYDSKLKVCDQMFWHVLRDTSLNSYISVPCACVQAEEGCHDGYEEKWRRYGRIGIRREDYDE